MSRGTGVLQQCIMQALIERALTDRFPSPTPPCDLYDDLISTDVVTARWRWYTIDLLGITTPETPRSARVSAHRAVQALSYRGMLETSGYTPYPQPFAAYEGHYGELRGGLDLSELTHVAPQWPARSGRTLWFRIPPPEPILGDPDDLFGYDQDGFLILEDQIDILDSISVFRPDAFSDFVESTDTHGRWHTPTGRFLVWLFCGRP